MLEAQDDAEELYNRPIMKRSSSKHARVSAAGLQPSGSVKKRKLNEQ